MSSNRLIYDTCAYKKSLDQSVGPLSYLLNPIKYENCSKCRMELGIVGGTDVSQIKGNLVDLENDLRGQTRAASLCPSHHYQPNCPDKIGDQCQPKQINIQGRSCGPPRTINTELLHLPPCQMIRYKPVPLPPPMKIQTCPAPAVQSNSMQCQPMPNNL